MKVILIEDVKKTGKKDEILNVKDGYGRYLITNNLAVLYTPKSKDILNKEQQEKQRQEDNAIKLASETKKKIENIKCSFIVKTGKQDKVFGSISNKQISEEKLEQLKSYHTMSDTETKYWRIKKIQY